jgi:anti-sigma factor RsiW
MSECWDEGGLRAYFDRELPPEDLSRVAAHIGVCAECHGRYNELAARATRVSSMMSALGVVAYAAAPAAPSRRRWVQPAALGATALALAAAAALAFVWIPKPTPQAQPVAAPHVERSHRPIQAEAPPAAAVPTKVVHAKAQRHAKPAETDYYLALDDEPIDMGVVMRVALDSAAAVQADVIFDAEGRPRAIRPVKQSSK